MAADTSTGTGPAYPAMPDPWTLRYEGFEPAEEGLREVLCAVGNGYLVTRGAAPEAVADGVHYPGTYLAGCYDRAASTVAGRVVTNEDLVNCPNWLPLTFRPTGGHWFTGPPAEQSVELDLRRGVLTRHALVVDSAGRRTRLVQRRLASQAQPHLVALESTFTPENWSGPLEIRSALDGVVANTGVARYRGLTDRHLEPAGHGTDENGVLWLEATAAGSPLRIALAARTSIRGCDERLRSADGPGEGRVAQILTVDGERGRPVTVEKTVAVHTSHDPAIETPLHASRLLAARAPGFDRLLAEHALRWTELWHRCRIEADFGAPVRCTSTCSTYCRPTPSTPSTSMSAYPRAGCTARPTVATSSGTSCSSSSCSTCGSRSWPAPCCATATAVWTPPGRLPTSRGSAARCTRGRARATAGRSRSSCT